MRSEYETLEYVCSAHSIRTYYFSNKSTG
jgi:hypothetical protein